MRDLGDLDLDKARESPVEERRGLGWRLLLVAGLVAAVGYLMWSLATSSRRPGDVRVATDQKTAPVTPSEGKAAEPGENIELAPLDETDPIVRQLVGRLSAHPKIAAWLTSDQLIRNFVVIVMNIADGRSPAQHVRRLRPTGDFIVAGDGESARIDPRSYRRYDDYADAVGALDARGVARLYATLKPRIEDAYREQGYPDGDFDPALGRAIRLLLDTPVVEGDIRLRSHSVAWEFADPKLQSLSGAQRQFLRMGPRNMRIIQAKLREIAQSAGINP